MNRVTVRDVLPSDGPTSYGLGIEGDEGRAKFSEFRRMTVGNRGLLW